MRVMWETNQKLPGRVEYGPTTALGLATEVEGQTELHEVTLRGLEPGTKYYYRVRSGELASELFSFRTAPPPETERWRMALYGDSRSNPTMHRKVAEQVAKANVDLILHTGDIVLDGRRHETWREQFFEPLGTLARSVPWVSTIGNHERDSANYFSYMALPGNERYFGFDFGNAHIVCLDSNAWIEKGRDSAQYQWILDHLRQKRPATWTFVAFHHPLFSAHATRPINNLRWDWAPLFLDPDLRVDGVFTGHDHFYARNYRMGRLGDLPHPGVLFLTSAGGGASLYRTKQRDYVARERSVHHFTLFEFDGDQVTLSAIDITGTVLDRYQLTKNPTPPEEFCAYEIEELREYLRRALVATPAVATSEHQMSRIDTRLSVPTRFRVPVAGQFIWESVSGWKLARPRSDFRLQPGQALEISLQAEVAPGALAKTPGLTIAFEPGRFRNRTVDVHPFKLKGPDQVAVVQAKDRLTVDGKLQEDAWQSVDGNALLGLPPGGGRADRVKFLLDRDWLYVGAKLDDSPGQVKVKPSQSAQEPSRLVLAEEHIRLLVSDGQETWSFALSPGQVRYTTRNGKEDPATTRQGAAGREDGAWCVELAVPRRLFLDMEKLRVNLLHRRRGDAGYLDYELCPTYMLGSSPDVIPDWKPGEAVDRWATLALR
jgi:hypothetical protein